MEAASAAAAGEAQLPPELHDVSLRQPRTEAPLREAAPLVWLLAQLPAAATVRLLAQLPAAAPVSPIAPLPASAAAAGETQLPPQLHGVLLRQPLTAAPLKEAATLQASAPNLVRPMQAAAQNL